jgi:hypothetical protein
MEIWRPVVGYEGLYEVSDLGNVRSLDREVVGVRYGKEVTWKLKGKMLKPCQDGNYGLLAVKLPLARTRKIHRLVMEAFVGPCPENMEVCHWNGIPSDNRLENLRYDTHSANMQDAIRHGSYHSEKCKAGYAKMLSAYTPERRSLAARRWMAAKTPAERSLNARKGWETRRNG